jgi:DNA invertase Pin-like site-specific DNA recombinase
VNPGDTIVFDEVSRMSRNAEEGFQLYKDFFNQGVELEFIKEPHINTAVYREALDKQVQSITTGDSATDELMEAIIGGINRYMMRLAEQQIKIAFNQAEKEVQDLRQRTREGIETARLNGKQIGGSQGKKLVVKKAQPAKDAIRKYSKDFNGSLDDTEVMKLVGVARNTYYKYKKEMREEG